MAVSNKNLELVVWSFIAWLFSVIGVTLVYFVTGLIGLEFGVVRPDTIPIGTRGSGRLAWTICG